MKNKKAKAVFAAWIKAMQDNGFNCDSPYEIENFMADHFGHSKLIDAGLFPKMREED